MNFNRKPNYTERVMFFMIGLIVMFLLITLFSSCTKEAEAIEPIAQQECEESFTAHIIIDSLHVDEYITSTEIAILEGYNQAVIGDYISFDGVRIQFGIARLFSGEVTQFMGHIDGDSFGDNDMNGTINICNANCQGAQGLSYTLLITHQPCP